MNDKPAALKHLSNASRRWYQQITSEFVLETHHLPLLLAAAECWDRATQARELLSKEGLCFKDRHGHIRPHPAASIETTNKALFSRLLRELALDVSEPEESRPPAISGKAGLRAED